MVKSWDLKLNDEEKKMFLLSEGKTILASFGNFQSKDLDKYKILRSEVQRLFGNFSELVRQCGGKVKQRNVNMNDDETRNFLLHIKELGPNGCWLTTYFHSFAGRPRINFRGKLVHLSRISYLLFNGPLLRGNIVMHECNNKACFNPKHLKLGTHQENARYCVESGRHRSGETSKKRGIKDPYDFHKLLDMIKRYTTVSSKDEWLYNGYIPKDGYPKIDINKKRYALHRLVLANKLGVTYEQINIARHVLPDGSRPQKHDLNPDHLLDGTLSDNVNDTFCYKKTQIDVEGFNQIKKELTQISIPFGKAGEVDVTLAIKYGISSGTVRKIRLGESYKIFQDGNVIKAKIGKPVLQLTKDNKVVARYSSTKEAAIALNCSASGISQAANKKLKHFKNFVWAFEESSNA